LTQAGVAIRASVIKYQQHVRWNPDQQARIGNGKKGDTVYIGHQRRERPEGNQKDPASAWLFRNCHR
jgi:hypothetical protein